MKKLLKLLARFERKIKKKLKGKPTFEDYRIKEISPILPLKDSSNKLRLNLVITSMNKKDIFGGIKTALDFFLGFCEFLNAEKRILILNYAINPDDVLLPDGFKLWNKDSAETSNVLIDISDRKQAIPIGCNDVFVTTFWNTTYCILELNNWFEKNFHKSLPIIYFIQDYEPGFYSWSSRFVLAESTYKDNRIIPVFNSFSLAEYFKNHNYAFKTSYVFHPKLNPTLKTFLGNKLPYNQRKNQILIYGRPFNQRNCFELILMALNEWYVKSPLAKDFTVYSAGADFPQILFTSGLQVHNLGKLSLEDYSKFLGETKIGISLMASPHPSYPPLEMATFGIKVITNCFFNKDISDFNKNIVSLPVCNISSIVNALENLTQNNNEIFNPVDNSYLDDIDEEFINIYRGLKKDLNLK